MLAFVQSAALGAHPGLRFEMYVMVVEVIEDVGQWYQREAEPRVDLKGARGYEGVGAQKMGEGRRRRGGGFGEEGLDDPGVVLREGVL